MKIFNKKKEDWKNVKPPWLNFTGYACSSFGDIDKEERFMPRFDYETFMRNCNWKTAGQVYGILSRFAFIVEKEGRDVDEEYIEAFKRAEDSLTDELDLEAFEMLIEAIEEYRGAHYKLDILEESKKPEMTVVSNMDKEAIKRMVKEIAKLLDGDDYED